MPLDFPSAPAINDTWTASNGATYTWDGTKWTVSGSGGAGVMSFNNRSGDVTLNSGDVTGADGLTTEGGVVSGSLMVMGETPLVMAGSVPTTQEAALGVPRGFALAWGLGDGSQRVAAFIRSQVSSIAATPPSLEFTDAGIEISRPLKLSADPIDALHATTKQYVDGQGGSVGEFRSAQRLSTGAISLTTTVSAVIATLSLTAGDWHVWAALGCNTTTSTGNPVVRGWINPAGGAAPPSIDQLGGNVIRNPTNAATQILISVPALRVVLASTGNVTLGATVTFGNGTYAGWGQIMARRAVRV